MNRLSLAIILLLICQLNNADEIDIEKQSADFSFEDIKPNYSPTAAVIYDSINKLNGQVGFRYNYNYSEWSNDFFYSKLGKSKDNESLEIGFGGDGEFGSMSYGLDYIHTNENPILGVNMTFDFIILMFKLGFYHDQTTNKPRFMIGFGVGK